MPACFSTDEVFVRFTLVQLRRNWESFEFEIYASTAVVSSTRKQELPRRKLEPTWGSSVSAVKWDIQYRKVPWSLSSQQRQQGVRDNTCGYCAQLDHLAEKSDVSPVQAARVAIDAIVQISNVIPSTVEIVLLTLPEDSVETCKKFCQRCHGFAYIAQKTSGSIATARKRFGHAQWIV